VAKLKARAERWNPALAFVVTLVEAVLTLLLVRFAWRAVKRGGTWVRTASAG
jgi:HAE1 family hydrophobic/amphiphilic exporter-1